MKKRGAMHPAMDSFKMKESQGLQMDYSMNMCPKTLDLLARTAYVSINPDWTVEDVEKGCRNYQQRIIRKNPAVIKTAGFF